ncbi:uncharacterized protein LY89DRAFT_236727 [Mollisia scopiformis]|uniref:Uncharacterized protein n=1 Tax=Mollisia scopiformis TaxID=149040 RepID=A0A194WT15_MOLSC|nr:uncharacterized protein LY89DRAFT_236727 [Mollisia scopiformis]KUJ11096.1 hypothetical protein LY89DRAFT_236727 [Mollisia scopiformis]
MYVKLDFSSTTNCQPLNVRVVRWLLHIAIAFLVTDSLLLYLSNLLLHCSSLYQGECAARLRW